MSDSHNALVVPTLDSYVDPGSNGNGLPQPSSADGRR
jgi:hypothetical protein